MTESEPTPSDNGSVPEGADAQVGRVAPTVGNGPAIVGDIEADNHETFRQAIENAINEAL